MEKKGKERLRKLRSSGIKMKEKEKEGNEGHRANFLFQKKEERARETEKRAIHSKERKGRSRKIDRGRKKKKSQEKGKEMWG